MESGIRESKLATPLLKTKLYIPPVRPDLVSRPRLIERLNAGPLGQSGRFARKLTLISAPAGFGKTTLLSEWVHHSETRFFGKNLVSRPRPPVAWLSLDEGDDDPARFLAYFVTALQTLALPVPSVAEKIGAGTLSALQSPHPPPMASVLTTLINEIAAVPSPFVLVLDDYHLITAQPIHDGLTFLLDHLPPQMHLIIATRADPPLPIARLRGRGQLTELRLTDLRFTPDEAAAFLNQVMGLGLAADDVAVLASRTEGWIAGLQMAALSLREKEDVSRFVAAFTGSNRYILDYLLEEVLRREPEYLQTFLLQTSILDQLCGPLCDAVIGDWRLEIGVSAESPISNRQSQSILEHLEASNLFILPLDNGRRWYRYHRLFADLLRQRLHQSPPSFPPARGGDASPSIPPASGGEERGGAPVLHRRASEWFEQNGLVAEAIDHALAAEDLERAADLIEQNAEATLMRGEVATFLRWVSALPDELVHARPSLCVFYAWILLMRGQPLEVIESFLHNADRGDEIVAGRVTALRGLMAGFQGQVSRAVALSRRALEQLPEEDQFVRTFATWLLRTLQLVGGEGMVDSQPLDDVLRMSQRAGNVMLSVMVVCNRAELLMRQGQLHKAAATYRKALELTTGAQGQRMPIAGQALIGLGELSRQWGDLDAAVRYLLEGIELTEQWSEVGPLEAYICLARIRQAQGDVDGAWQALEKAQELAVKFDLTDLDDLTVAMFQAWMRVAQGDLGPARRWAEERDLYQYVDSPLREKARDPYDHRLRKYELLVLARLLIAQGQPAEALKMLESLVPLAEWRGRPGMLIEIYALQALACQAQGDVEQAMAALERALSLAEPEGHVRIFADEGEPMARLLQEAARRGIAPGFVNKSLAAFGVSKDRGTEEPLPSPQAQSLPEPLSARELEVLRLLNTHLSSTEIAEELFISVNTARFHIKNIYGKLGVHGRSEAVQRARELGLL